MKNPESTQFGERTVTPEEKTGLVRGVFGSVADNYDRMNDLMSGGLHRLWKDRFVRMIRPRPGQTILDVAGGTGDIAFRMKRRILESQNLRNRRSPSEILKFRNSEIPITICDLTEDMLRVGRDRAIDKGWVEGFDWVTGNAEDLPFPENSFDLYTIAFGLRNVTRIDAALKEAVRVLKPGGRFFCLEFSHVREPLLAKAYDLYSSALIPRMGQLVANDRESYQYLIESIRKFPRQEQLVKRMDEAGLKKSTFTNLSAGIVAIHTGFKP